MMSRAAEAEVEAVPRMLDMDGPSASKALQAALAIGLGLMVLTAAYGLISWGLAPDESLDSDGDGMPDSWELKYSGEPKISAPDGRSKKLVGLDYTKVDSNADPDRDGLSNLQEFCWPLTIETCSIDDALTDERGGVSGLQRLNPLDADTDDDGIPDGIEVVLCVREMSNASLADDGLCLNFSPLIDSAGDHDADGYDLNQDGYLDSNESFNSSEEVWFGSPSSWKTELDGLWKGGTDPLQADSDSDGVPDGVEIAWSYDPLDNSDGSSDLDQDGWLTPLTAAQEWDINSKAAVGGLLAIPISSQYAVAKDAEMLMDQTPTVLTVHSNGAVWLGLEDALIHVDEQNNSTSFAFNGVSDLELHEGVGEGWLAISHTAGLTVIELAADGSAVDGGRLQVNESLIDFTRLLDKSGTTRLAYLTESGHLGVLEMDGDGAVISSWNASASILQNLSESEVTAMEFSPATEGAGRLWVALDGGLLEIRSDDLLDSQALIEWHLGPYNDPDNQTAINRLVADPDHTDEGWVMALRGPDLLRFTGIGGVHQSLDLTGQDKGDISAVLNSGYGEWLWATDEGVWSLDFNKRVEERVSETPLILAEVATISIRGETLLVSTVAGNYAGIILLDPRLNDSDSDGWQDGFELMMGTDPTRPADTFGCNGYAILCTRLYDDVTYPATHNSHANPESGFNNIAENQLASLTGQLEMGIRYINMDLYEYGDEVWVCHGEWDLPIHPCLQSGGERASNQFEEIYDFMAANPHEVITLAFENYVNATVVLAELDSAELSGFLFSKNGSWPTLGEMVSSDKRLVIMADDENQGFSWWHDEHDETRMTAYQYQSEDEFECANARGNDNATMLQVAHYITDPLSSEADAQLVNQFDSMWRHAQKCIDEHGMVPNFILVDYADYGDAVLVAAVLNGVEEAPPGALS